MTTRIGTLLAAALLLTASAAANLTAQHAPEVARSAAMMGTEAVQIQFAARAGALPLACGVEIPALGVTRSRAQITDFRMYVSDFRLVTADGEEVPIELDRQMPWSNGQVALLDFEDGTGLCANGTPQTNHVVLGKAPEGDYRGLRFAFGVPFELNHQDPTVADSPMDLTALFWNWNAGYKFVRLDLVTTGQPQGFFFHLGSTRCAPSDSRVTPATNCAQPNRANVSLDGFDPASDKVVIDIAELLAQANVDVRGEMFAGCMSGRTAACDPILGALGIFGDRPQRLARIETTSAP